MRKIAVLAAAAAISALASAPESLASAPDSLASASESPAAAPHSLAVFDRAMRIVEANFYDRSLRGLPWDRLAAEERKTLTPSSSEAELKASVNRLLDRLNASHTQFYSDGDQTFWALRSIFSHKIKGSPLRQIGAWFDRQDGKWFVRNVLEGSPAHDAGILAGDEIVEADGQPLEPVRSFRTLHAARGVRLTVRRSPQAATQSIHVATEFKSFQEAMLTATRKSERLLRHKGRTIGYFHLWSGTHERFLEALRHAAGTFETKADAVVLDLRDGFGGAHPGYVEPFEVLTEDESSPMPVRHRFTKPVVVIVNEGTRSGKEWVAFLFKKAGRTLVGTTTKGAFLAGRPYLLGEGKYLLYLAVKGTGPLGVDIEGKGVAPDIEVPYHLPYSAGADPQLERAIAEAHRQAAVNRGPSPVARTWRGSESARRAPQAACRAHG